MFYSTELLSLRRKGKLARCWLAAIFSEKMFKRTCKPVLIKKINVALICEEILTTIEIRNGRSYGRFSLYLSSQLMYGAAKILFYQTKYFQDYLFDIKWKLYEIKRYGTEFNGITTLEMPDVPPINEVFRNLEVSSNLHLITEEPYTSAIEHLMQDEMNFGILPQHDLEKFILGVEDLPLNEIRRFHWDQSAEIPGESIQVPLVDVNKFEIDTIETEKETRVASAGSDQRKSLIVSKDPHVKKPTVSRKRTLSSPTETPIKRSKIEENLPPMLPTEPLAEPLAESAPMTEVLPPPELQEEGLSKVLEVTELPEVTRSRKKRKLFDRQIKLSDTLMRKYIQNVTAHTIKEHPWFMPTLPSAKEYLRQPSTKIFNKLWGETLTKFFSQYFIKPLAQTVQDEFQDILFEIERTIAGETIRVDVLSKTDELTEKTYIRKNMTTTYEMIDPSKMSEQILSTENLERKLEEKRKETKESEEALIPDLPEITDFEEKIEKSSDEKKTKSSSSSESKTCLTKKELLVLIEIHWRDSTLIKFHTLISSENYNKLDAATAFRYCLEFHAEKVLILKQAEPYDTIWIEKYPYYISKSGSDIATA
ncbi:hypothetical protein QLX08_008479 [Tetragonisca angustula]|uniref:Rad21/Rec8-like protein N-terminal domain-containing protein n=1 Tax=Tetragonisca angustula TaxID=166442 RepID=A0AAW0ZMN1_9HYME